MIGKKKNLLEQYLTFTLIIVLITTKDSLIKIQLRPGLVVSPKQMYKFLNKNYVRKPNLHSYLIPCFFKDTHLFLWSTITIAVLLFLMNICFWILTITKSSNITLRHNTITWTSHALPTLNLNDNNAHTIS